MLLIILLHEVLNRGFASFRNADKVSASGKVGYADLEDRFARFVALDVHTHCIVEVDRCQGGGFARYKDVVVCRIGIELVAIQIVGADAYTLDYKVYRFDIRCSGSIVCLNARSVRAI